MLDVNLVELLTAAGVLYTVVVVHAIQRRLDRLDGKVDAQGEDLRAHVNAPGLHR